MFTDGNHSFQLFTVDNHTHLGIDSALVCVETEVNGFRAFLETSATCAKVYIPDINAAQPTAYCAPPRDGHVTLSRSLPSVWCTQLLELKSCGPIIHGRPFSDNAEWRVPSYSRVLYFDILLPILSYVALWYSVNLTISGVYLLVFLIRNWNLMISSPLHYYSYFDTQIILMSIGYFLHDVYDVVRNDKLTLGTTVLILHHGNTLFILLSIVASHKFLIYAYWGLLMEVSSIFLHARSLLHISKLSQTSMIVIAKIVGSINICAFVVFRFGIQAFLIGWAWVNRHNMTRYYLVFALGGGGIFLIINIGLFLRILQSDGLLRVGPGRKKCMTDSSTNHHKKEN